MNIPSTWQTETSRSLYLAELQRLSQFLVAGGGARPSREALAAVMRAFDGARGRLREIRDQLSGRELAAALITVRETAEPGGRPSAGGPVPSSDSQPIHDPSRDGTLRLALVGGPLPESDYGWFDWIEQAGGRIVLDATGWGERTLPRAFTTGLAGREMAARRVCGLIVRRYLWCDLWHAEVATLKAWRCCKKLARGRVFKFQNWPGKRQTKGRGTRPANFEI